MTEESAPVKYTRTQFGERDVRKRVWPRRIQRRDVDHPERSRHEAEKNERYDKRPSSSYIYIYVYI